MLAASFNFFFDFVVYLIFLFVLILLIITLLPWNNPLVDFFVRKIAFVVIGIIVLFVIVFVYVAYQTQ